MIRTLFVAFACTFVVSSAMAAEPDGLVLPPGFHASLVAEGLGPIRHMAIRNNNEIYLSTRHGNNAPSTGIIAIRLGPDHKVVETQKFSTIDQGTGIRIYKDALYAASGTTVYRIPFTGNELVPTGTPEAVVEGMPAQGSPTHPIALDGNGNLYISLDGPANICTDPNSPKGAPPKGLKPCPGLTLRASVWRFSADKTGQKFPADGTKLATGVRDMGAMDWRPGDGLYGIMHGRDATHDMWPDLVSASDDDAIPDEMHRITDGTDFGWPYTYYDSVRKIRLMGPEYGGDNKTAVTDGPYTPPLVDFGVQRGAPLDIAFYEGKEFPASYRGGAFIAFHGGGGAVRPTGRAGYDVVFVPFSKAGVPGKVQKFAEGFAGPAADSKNAGKAAYRPVGLGIAPDGSLYVAESNKGRIWRISYGK